MPNKRLTTMNQWGDILYIGKHKLGAYRNIGDYAEQVPYSGVAEILTKLYYLEEAIEVFEEGMKYYGERNAN